MEKRSFERVSTKEFAIYMQGNKLCPAIVRDISKNGMYIESDLSFPQDSKFELYIPRNKSTLEVTVQVSRLVKDNNEYTGMGVKLASSHSKYQQFVDELHSMLV